MRLAFAQAGATQLELIQPLTDNNIYAEQLARRGEGLHHVGVFVPSLDAGIAEAEREGFSVLQSGRGYGRLGDGGFAYLDTEAQVGMIVELIEVPKERVPPEMVFPSAER
jgi:4-hydroxyphenylpyruvate dioxygenase-like putative hemolysin